MYWVGVESWNILFYIFVHVLMRIKNFKQTRKIIATQLGPDTYDSDNFT